MTGEGKYFESEAVIRQYEVWVESCGKHIWYDKCVERCPNFPEGFAAYGQEGKQKHWQIMSVYFWRRCWKARFLKYA